jgi:hypothetical protein
VDIVLVVKTLDEAQEASAGQQPTTGDIERLREHSALVA